MGNPTGDFLGGVPKNCFPSNNPCQRALGDAPSSTQQQTQDFDQEGDDPRFATNCGFKVTPQDS